MPRAWAMAPVARCLTTIELFKFEGSFFPGAGMEESSKLQLLPNVGLY